MLTRYTLPIRDIALSPDGQWAAVASEYVEQEEATHSVGADNLLVN